MGEERGRAGEEEQGWCGSCHHLQRAQLIPPAPNRRPSNSSSPVLHFLPDFGGSSWIAYGAHSLLVISHFNPPPPPPSPSHHLRFQGNLTGIPRQVIELHPPSASVRAVAWCPALPSQGELAAASANSISIYAPLPEGHPGPFSWQQKWAIVETFTINAISWTGSGDGLIAVGTDVVLWARKESSWEVAWRSGGRVPQSLVSATWFAQGPVATAAGPLLHDTATPVEESGPFPSEEHRHVVVYLNDVKSGLTKFQLAHPNAVSLIQWRPHNMKHREVDLCREILMTCCLDGAVRLWSENDGGRSRKHSKDAHEAQPMRSSFIVIAIIEINNALRGALGTDINLRWAIEKDAVVSRTEGGKYDLFSGHSVENQVGTCEWLISVGPGSSVNFWAVHCLDDVCPPRYPRITLWKESKLMDCVDLSNNTDPSKSKEQQILVEVLVSRRLYSGPPTMCSLLHLLPDDSFILSRLSSTPSSDICGDASGDATNGVSWRSTRISIQDGHKGRITQVSVHPYSCEIELAVSLDSTGILLFWSLSTLSTFIRSLQTPAYPLWKLLGKFNLCSISTVAPYSCVTWAPSVVHNKRFLILGGENGVDCFIIGIPKEGEGVQCHKMFTVPFLGSSNREGPPDSIYTTPLASDCDEPFFVNSFLLFCIWKKSFRALSWKVVLHSENQYGGRCACGFTASSLSTAEEGRYASHFEGKMYSVAIYAGSSVFPTCLDGEHTTSLSVTTLSNAVLPIQQHVPCRNTPIYHIATGCSNGTLKLWRMSCVERALQTEGESISWELVGTLSVHQGPVTAVSFSSCGRIATVSKNVQTNSTYIHIWEAINITGGGAFLLEDALVFQGPVVGLHWLSLGNGLFLLGVCLSNELHIYSHVRPHYQNVIQPGNSKKKQLWSCIAVARSRHDIKGFLWGPKVTTVLIHEKHLALLNPWLLRTAASDKYGIPSSTGFAADAHKELPCAKYLNGTNDKIRSSQDFRNMENGDNSSILCPDKQDTLDAVTGWWNLLDVAHKLGGSLPFYHPAALIQYLYSGKWKRADVVLQHLAQSVQVGETSKIKLKCSSCGKSCHSIPELPLSEYLMDTSSNSISNKGLQWGENKSSAVSNLLFSTNSFPYMEVNLDLNIATTTSQKSERIQLRDKNFGITAISDIERIQILSVADLLGEITDQNRASPYKSLDEAGRRFWVAVQFQRLYVLRRFGDSSSVEGHNIDSASIAWALQSDCQDDLLNSILPAESSWSQMRNLGIGLWYTNVPQLRTRMEKLARLQYLKNKDPKDCALLYIALNRIQVLVGLFKISRDEKDKRLYEFLSRNFQEEKHKSAALKNAYVLMGRHQWELAIAFFLLGGDPSSAIAVCAKNLGDEQLALVICRLVEGSGGPLERNLISNLLLPSAVEKGDYWLSSLLEWTLGNYSQSVEKLFDCHVKSLIDESGTLWNQTVCSEPGIGHYCAILATKSNFRNSVGEVIAGCLSKLSIAMAANALNRCGLPLEALECLSCTSSIDSKDSGTSLYTGDHSIFHRILSPFSSASSNWISDSVVSDIELNLKVTMASKYLSSLLRGHPPCPEGSQALAREKITLREYSDHQIGELGHDVKMAISIFEKRFSLKFADLAENILTFSCNDELMLLAYLLLWVKRSPDGETDSHGLECCLLRPIKNLLLKACKEICCFVAQHVFSCSFTYAVLNFTGNNTFACVHKDIWQIGLTSLSSLLRISRLLLKHDNRGTCALDNASDILAILDLLEYHIEFAFAWLAHDIKALIVMIGPVLVASVNGESFQVVLDRLIQVLREKNCDITNGTVEGIPCGSRRERQTDNSEVSLSVDEKWLVVGASLWIQFSSFMKHYLAEFIEKCRHEGEDIAGDVELIDLEPSLAAIFVMESLDFISSSLVKQLASFLRQKLLKHVHSSALSWLESSQPRSLNNGHPQQFDSIQIQNYENTEELFDILWEISASPLDICTAFATEEVSCFPSNNLNLTRSWQHVERGTAVDYENSVSQKVGAENKYSIGSENNEAGKKAHGSSGDAECAVEAKRKDLIVHKEVSCFQSPRELLRRNGELLEAICPNSINEQQVAIATNRKGLIFFNWNGNQHDRQLADYVWSESDWPLDGWAGCESTPVRTFVSPGVGLGSKRGAHLGLGGATIGLGSLAKPGRDLTGGGAFGIPGYAGIGASGLGWGEQEEFEEFIDPPATLENIHSRALSRHPSLPLLLVGSSNTHVYLWEFGKESALATYGVLPAANVPPPYALASISAVQFDHYGQRFATAALDGTVSTWQLEVGGRSNVHPTESSLCFSSHASDVAYVAASGSVVAAAGCSANGANVVIWDTLGPPSTCQASVVCHEGGARSLSVFDSDIGSPSISPLIVTGGKSGDVALHDFRFIATGKAKSHKNPNEQDAKTSTMHDTRSGTCNGGSANGMIWYIPKAHLGSVSTISTIPNTSLFLTGSKDGDVKLWDAKNSRLVFHWQRLHERHTFFQPTSRGFGGVVRAAITDIQVLSNGFITCGGDGCVKLIQIK